ncbi:MAG TPA: hypothetical protein VH740_24860 [Vicinamibacterales bacterium]
MKIARRHILQSLAAAAAVIAFAGTAEAGPPLLCHPFDAGKAKLLPWSANPQSWNALDPSYDVKRLPADTLALLSPDAPILARMENLRRATLYAAQDERIAAELLSAIAARMQADTGKGRDPLAWFDAGYLIESYRQASHIYKWNMLNPAEKSSWTMRAEPNGLDGYSMVAKAIRLVGTSPEMEFAASLMKDGPTSAEHRRRALAGAPAGSLLAKNLAPKP